MNLNQTIEFLEKLLYPKNYINFLKSLPQQRDFLDDVDEWLSWFNNNVDKLTAVLEKIAYRLLELKYEVLYPIEMIVVPRYPFTKKPMVNWSLLQDRPFSDYEVNRLKYVCSKLGNLINVAFLCRGIVVIDIDVKDPTIRPLVDVETRRGYHIIRWLEDYEAIEVRVGDRSDEVSGTKVVFKNDKVQIEVFSGRHYLESHPLQTRYLEYDNGLVNVRAYKIVSKEAEYAFKSADLTPLKAKPQEIEDLLKQLLKRYGFDKQANTLRVIPLKEVETSKVKIDSGVGTPKKESLYNKNFFQRVGVLTYQQFKDILAKHIDVLPTCLKHALFDNIPKGVRFFHGQLLRIVIPNFVYLDKDQLKAVIDDWISRCGRTKSDVTKAKYLWLYFTGKRKINDQEVRVPSRVRLIGEKDGEIWTTFYNMGYCEKCPIKEMCLKVGNKEKRKIIVDYVDEILRKELMNF